MPAYSSIADALAALPVGADRIAEHLAGLDVKAECHKPSACALAVYLLHATGQQVKVTGARAVPIDHQGVMIQSGSVWFGRPTSFALHREQTVLNRSDLVTFIAAFDDGAFPALVAEDTTAGTELVTA